jgi:hypothetical protein
VGPAPLRALCAVVLVGVVACGGSVAPARRATAVSGGDASAVVWEYEVSVDGALDLDVRATFRGPIQGELGVDRPAAPFVERLELAAADGASWRAVEPGDASLNEACALRCTVRYHLRLRDAAKAIDDLDVALASGGAIFAPPSTWLLRPSRPAAGRYRFHVAAAAPVRFATGVRAAAGAPQTYEAPTHSIDEAAFAAFGALRLGHVADPGIEHVIAPDVALPDDVVAGWLRTEVAAISAYFGRPPDGHAMLFVVPGVSRSTGGKTLGGGGASVFVRLASNATARDLAEDWVVAHELIHVAFPDLDRRHSWFSEGLATYVEPIARAHAGLITGEKVWADMMLGLPQGLPHGRNRGLDGAREWGRLYWGGALYFFLADIRIRERTTNARSLQDALRAVVATGGNVETMWPIARVIEIGDRATGTTVLRDTYEELGRSRGSIDLAAVFAKLGLRLDRGVARFDDAAPLAGIRDAILPRRPAAR